MSEIESPLHFLLLLGLREQASIELATTAHITPNVYLYRVAKKMKSAQYIDVFIPLPEFEYFLKTDPGLAGWYSRSFLRRRWREAEDCILSSCSASFFYARDVIQGPWPAAEHLFLDDPRYAMLYATRIMKHRWPEAEPIISTRPELMDEYAIYFFPEPK